ncbi:DUF3164 family protein [Sphingomonas sp. H39-1-10]|uniref:DUF3164 family protein n=1 Tax=Sphingomonas pollutisoli TaxID=3030829 RepID=UPI0023B8AAD4|nr:DUF3164 family protein [Sphingomonas pollutisoli]MDF0489194.1 DUF3164 family protein [Sphingomonas pollutisoli]
MSGAQHPAAIEVGGLPYLRDAKGALVPIAAIKPADLLMDELVRRLLGDAVDLSTLLSGFKRQVFDQVGAHQALIAQEFGAKIGGTKGNITLTTFDGTMRVLVNVADQIEFGPEIQAAKALIDECLSEWAATGGVELRALVNRVFQVDQQGTINRAEVFMLLRVQIEDPRWQRAMDAIRDSMRVIGSKTYVRFQQRDAGDAPWRSVTLDMASA